MGLFDFVKDAGEKLFKFGKGKEESNAAKAETLTSHVKALELDVTDLHIAFDDGVATVKGKTSSQKEREKIVLAVGNTEGVGQVDDQLTVEAVAAATMYTVKPGDSLSKIAKAHYGDAMKYPTIFEANKPMLTHPDKIYPGQVLRIPPIS